MSQSRRPDHLKETARSRGSLAPLRNDKSDSRQPGNKTSKHRRRKSTSRNPFYSGHKYGLTPQSFLLIRQKNSSTLEDKFTLIIRMVVYNKRKHNRTDE